MHLLPQFSIHITVLTQAEFVVLGKDTASQWGGSLLLKHNLLRNEPAPAEVPPPHIISNYGHQF